MRKTDHWIAGKSEVPESGRYLTVTDPRSGEGATEVALGTRGDVARAVESARTAQPAWAALAPAERSRILVSIGHALRSHAEELAEIEISETGKLAAVAEMEGAADFYEYYGGIVRAFFGDTIGIGPGLHAYTRHEPFGVVGMITAWNGPLHQASRGIAPALATGNAVVLKPSEFTSSTAVRLGQIASEVGLPEGLLNVVTGLGPEVGAALCDHEDVSKMVFTGSVVTGRLIAQAAARRLIPVTLELGGKSANVVFADADLEAAAHGVANYTANCGQICSALTRLLIESSVKEEFVARVVEIVDSITPGDRLQPLATEAQFAKVQSYFEIAAADGAKLLTGGVAANVGPLEKGRYVKATVYGDVTPSMRIFHEEIFGPVLTVTAFSNEEEAIALANATDYGLAAGIWTGDVARAHRVAARLDAGQVLVNGGHGNNETPFGGFKNSGIGREKGFDSLRDYTQTKTVVIATRAEG